ALGTAQINAQADALKVQAATVGMSVGEAAAYTAEHNRLNDAIRNGQILMPNEIALIHQAATAYGVEAQAAAQAAAANKASFDLQTVFMADSERQIAQIQQSLHGNAWGQFMGDGLSQTIRLCAALKSLKAKDDEAAKKKESENVEYPRLARAA